MDDESNRFHKNLTMNTNSSIFNHLLQSHEFMKKITQEFLFRADCEKPVLRSRSGRGRGYAKARTK